MSSVTMYQFTVEGTGPFPVDMLRYDRCWPRSEGRDSIAIQASWDRHSRSNGAVQVRLDGLGEPTSGRWESFGWKIVEKTQRKVQT